MQSYESDLPIIEDFLLLGGKNLLEIGCGDGRLTSSLVPRTGFVTAIDPDPAQIALARKEVAGVDFRVGSGENLDFIDQSFDIIFFSYSLHHQNCAAALKEAMRVIRRDGNILIIEPTHDSEFTLLVSIFEKDEIPLLQLTLDYITSGSFNILRKETYCVDHRYADESELYQNFMNKFMTARDDRAVDKMEAILGNKKTEKPIIIKDMVNIFLLGK